MPAPQLLRFADDGGIPNSRLPVVLHRGAVPGADAGRLAALFRRHGWTNDWVGGIFSYHHYHSTAHEVLGVAAGSATVCLGGEGGRTVTLARGDVVVIPAGVGHRLVAADGDFSVVGAYAGGRDFDILRGEAGERPAADRRIAALPTPGTDPVLGHAGGVAEVWASGG